MLQKNLPLPSSE